MSISDESKDRQICCSFCGKPQEQARRLIAGPGVYICDECIELCMSILEDEADFQERSANYHNNDETVLLKPEEIKAKLDEYVIGQEKAKIALSVAVYNHYSGSISAAMTWKSIKATCFCWALPASVKPC